MSVVIVMLHILSISINLMISCLNPGSPCNRTVHAVSQADASVQWVWPQQGLTANCCWGEGGGDLIRQNQ